MRRFISLLAALAATIASLNVTSAATMVTTDPVGFTIAWLPANSDTFVSIPFTRPPEFTGAISSASGDTIAVSGNPWRASQFVYGGTQQNHYYVLIGPCSTTPAKEGHIFAITGNTTNSLIVDTTLENVTGIPANTQVTIIPYWTPATVFPAIDANVSFTPTALPPDYKTLIRIPDHSASGINLPYLPENEYYFSQSNNRWQRVSDDADASDFAFLPDSYFVVRNDNGAPTLPVTSLGAVILKKSSVPLRTRTDGQQDNAVSILRPLDVALDATGLTPADGSFGADDQLLLFDKSQIGFDKVATRIYTYDTAAAIPGWRLTGDSTLSDRGPDFIPSGSGFIIRKGGTADGQTTFWTNSFPVSAVSAVSRKMHGSLGPFDVPLPLTGPVGIECRLGGPIQVVFTFPTAVTFDNAMVTSGAGSVGSTSGNGTTTLIANLTGVTNQQRITLTLFGVNDGTNANDVAIPMGVLLDDTSGDGVVNSADITQTRRQSGNVVDSSNFREDVTLDGVINSADITAVRRQSGSALPPSP